MENNPNHKQDKFSIDLLHWSFNVKLEQEWNWLSLAGKMLWTELNYEKHFPLIVKSDGQNILIACQYAQGQKPPANAANDMVKTITDLSQLQTKSMNLRQTRGMTNLHHKTDKRWPKLIWKFEHYM